MRNDRAQRHPGMPNAAGQDQVSIYLEEYRQLYALVLYRLEVLDQRIPLATAGLTATLGTVVVAPASIQIGLLVAVPISLLLLFRSTVNHARSLEDALARIAGIESKVNELTGRPVLGFQRTHPGRNRVGGRTGEETVGAVLVAAMFLIAAGAWYVVEELKASESAWLGYRVLVGAIAAAMVVGFMRFRGYRYGAEFADSGHDKFGRD